MPPSKQHNNRKTYNWLIYKINDQFLMKNKNLYKGVLYDMGCGEAPYKDFFLMYAEKYVGVDWSDSHHTTKADIIANLNKPLPINSEIADTIISLSVLEHLSEPQIMLSEAYRILKPKGNIIIQVPFMWWVHEAPHDYFRYTQYGIQYLLEKVGFHNIEIIPQTGFWVMWTLKFNYQTNRLVRGPWMVRKIIEFVLRVVWGINQPIALLLDKYWQCEGETAGYYVVAKKA